MRLGIRAVDRRRPCSSVMTISWVARVPPRWMAVQVPVTRPSATERWCVAPTSIPTTCLSGPACKDAANDPSVSASTTCAPPWRIPATWVLPATGMVATVRSGPISTNLMPILTTSAPTPCFDSQPCSSWGTPASRSSPLKRPGVKLSTMPTRVSPVSETTKPDTIPATTATATATAPSPSNEPSPSAASKTAAVAENRPVSSGKPADGTRPRLMVLDGHSMAFRAFFALPADKFSTAHGQHTNAIHGFTSMLINLIKDQKPTHIAVAFDVSDETTHRKAEYSEYKGGRNETPREMSGQIDLIDELMGAWGIKTI